MNPISVEKSMDPRRIDMEGPILVAHQPEFMPWLGNISKAAMGDVYFLLDTVQYQKKYYQNRNKIRIKNNEGWQWLIVPVYDTKDKYINMMGVRIANKSNWKRKHLHAIELAYKKSPYFFDIYPELVELYYEENEYLVDFLVKIIRYALRKFDVEIPIYRVSELIKEGHDISGGKSDLIIRMCHIVNAKTYVFGISGKDYVEKYKFDKEGINVIFQEFKHPEYKQMQGNFISTMAFIDILFNHGTNARKILGKSSWSNL